ncbi:hypothetical protein yc1106_01101 [Curvularia clavata]|uniref:Thioesterase domain-containing protein n=1 Tax=Curvularia clavata TaxID=95742 RepID=A0A9Q8Z0J5_CURCL|nr:hypothetical protein yc1106_01101 [Curvularia clavata]
MDVVTSRISSIPWAAALINDPDWTRVSVFSREPKDSNEDSFVADTLKTDRTIRSYLTFRPVKEEEGGIPLPEIRTIVDLGTGVNGHPDTAHGGFSAILLDEACGTAVCLHRDIIIEQMRKRGQKFDGFHYYTAYLNVTYKKPMPTPGTYLCTVKIEREAGSGRKLFFRATIGDGNGTVYTIGEALFIRVTGRL